MSAIQQQHDYYEKYWRDDRCGHSGDEQGYASNFRRWMRAELNDLPPHSRILEVGCGDASFTRDLAQWSSEVTAIDIAAQQLERNARAYPEIRFIQHDLGQRLPFADGRFGLVWCSEVLEHLFDPAFALREMYRVLAPGGRLLVTVPYHGWFKNLLIALFKWDEHFDPRQPHIRFFSKNSLGQLAAAARFREIAMDTCGMNKPLRDLFIATNILMKAKKP